jgi:hypothetical protein
MISGLRSDTRAHGSAAWLWIVLIGVTSIALSRAFACATPFAALATLATFTLRDREAVGLVLFVWLANQVVGFSMLGYPWTASTFAWGAAIGAAALAGLIAARGVGRFSGSVAWVAMPVALIAAFVAYEMVLFATSWILPSSSGAYSTVVVLRIFAINVVAAGLLLGVGMVSKFTGWPITIDRQLGLPRPGS